VKVSNAIVAMPLLKEQQQIVEKTKQLMDLCDQLKKQSEKLQYFQSQLSKSIVNQVLI
jgi:restriction endonuclease S subunit